MCSYLMDVDTPNRGHPFPARMLFFLELQARMTPAKRAATFSGIVKCCRGCASTTFSFLEISLQPIWEIKVRSAPNFRGQRSASLIPAGLLPSDSSCEARRAGGAAPSFTAGGLKRGEEDGGDGRPGSRERGRRKGSEVDSLETWIFDATLMPFVYGPPSFPPQKRKISSCSET